MDVQDAPECPLGGPWGTEPFWVLYPIPVSRDFTVSTSSLSLHPQLEPVFPQLGDSHLQMLSCIKEKPFSSKMPSGLQ